MPDQIHHTMRCPHCQSSRITRLKTPTELGYRRFQCRMCRRVYNERTGTPFNFLEFPTDLVCLVVLWRLRYTLSLRDVVELCLLRGVELTHETVRDWEQRFAPYLTDQLKKRRRGKCTSRWHVDETYVKVRGQWVYYYRAIDRDGNLVDTMMSATRSKKAAIRFFKQAMHTTGVKPTLRHDGQIGLLPQSDPQSVWPEGDPPHQQIPEQSPRTGSPRHQKPPPRGIST